MGAPRGLVQRLDHELHKSGLLPRGAKLLVAVSGGADSVALLRLLSAVNGSDYWRWTLAVGHVEHGIRGAESLADALFVKKLAKELGAEFWLRKLKLAKTASEAAAREGRWKALAAMAKKSGCEGIVTGHQADDQAETVLMRMMRGCGVEGLGGIPARGCSHSLPVYRPLLEVRAAGLREYLREAGQAWREDATNASGRYTRNRIRAELLPLMESLYQGTTAALGRLSKVARETGELVSEVAEDLRRVAQVTPVAGSGEVFDRDALRSTRPVLCAELLRRSLRRLGGSTESADFERIHEAVRMVRSHHGGKCVELGKGLRVRADRHRVTVEWVKGGRRE